MPDKQTQTTMKHESIELDQTNFTEYIVSDFGMPHATSAGSQFNRVDNSVQCDIKNYKNP